MKSLRGLLRKEWSISRHFVIAMVTVSILLLIVETSHIFAGLQEDLLADTLKSFKTIFLMHMYFSIFLFFSSLMSEGKQGNLWFHSPLSMIRLVGAKLLFTSISVVISLGLSGIVMSTVIYIGWGTFPLFEDFTLLLSFLFATLMNCIYIMALGFFFWTIYQYWSSIIGKFAILGTGLTAIVWMIVWGVIWFSSPFQAMRELGALQQSITMSDIFSYHNYIYFALAPETAILAAGSIVLYVVISAFYLLTGSLLLEKKVRL